MIVFSLSACLGRIHDHRGAPSLWTHSGSIIAGKSLTSYCPPSVLHCCKANIRFSLHTSRGNPTNGALYAISRRRVLEQIESYSLCSYAETTIVVHCLSNAFFCIFSSSCRCIFYSLWVISSSQYFFLLMLLFLSVFFFSTTSFIVLGTWS